MLETIMQPRYATVSQRPGAVGGVWYVHAWDGDDTNSGHDPSAPLATITEALDRCTNDHNDYILVLEAYQEAMPILVNKSTVHILGIGGSPIRPFITLNATGATSIFQLDASGDYAEIAGFCFGGGDATACITQIGGPPYAVHIHHCNFGSTAAGNTPLHGIYTLNGTYEWLIEDCLFLGNGASVLGGITGDGILATGCTLTVIRNNIMLGLDHCINLLNASGGAIINNLLVPNADNAATGINLGGGCAGMFVADNAANFGETGMLANPYADVDSASHWVGNHDGAILAGTPWVNPF